MKPPCFEEMLQFDLYPYEMGGQRHPDVDKLSNYTSHTIARIIKKDDQYEKSLDTGSYRPPSQRGL